MEMTLRIEAPGLEGAINSLAMAIMGKLSLMPSTPVQYAAPAYDAQTTAILPQTPVALMPAPILAGAPTYPVPTQAVAPIYPAQTQPPVPTTAPTYTMDQLAVAATQFMDSPGHSGQEVLNLLARYGASSIMTLPKEQYGSFATELRALGGKI
jgi:hypothetical protein